jgi:hypothetical protein
VPKNSGGTSKPGVPREAMDVTDAERELLDSFAALTYPLESLDHAEHVRLAWALLAELPLLEAMCACRRLIVAYANHHGATDNYNETITCFYLLLIRERMGRLDANHGWNDFRLANSDLFESPRTFLEQWYPAGAAFLPEAKAAFRLPG